MENLYGFLFYYYYYAALPTVYNSKCFLQPFDKNLHKIKNNNDNDNNIDDYWNGKKKMR